MRYVVYAIQKNKFNFATLVTTIGLGASLLAGGCGDGGSTTPNSLNGGGDTPQPPTPEPPISDTYKVTFQYNSLAKNLGRTEVASDIVSVKYAFYGKTDNKTFTTAATKAHEFKHEAVAQEQDITIDATEVEELNDDIYGVTAAYYAEGDKLVAIGYDTVDWQGQKAVTITSPNLYRIGQDNDELSLTSYDPTTGKNKTVFKPGENVGLFFELIPNGETIKAYDLIPFATFSNLNDITDDKVTVLTATQGKTNGQFTAASKGTVKPKASVKGIPDTSIKESIIVTEQTIDKIELRPLSDEITALPSSEVTAFYMFYIDKKDAEGKDIPNATLGQEVVKTALRTAAHGTEEGATVGVDEVPMQVIATYTNDPTKGPQPQDVNIIDQVNLEANLVGSEGESLLKAQDGSLIATGTAPESYADQYEVVAKYGDKESKNWVFVLPATSELCFAQYFGEDVSQPLAYYPDNTITDEGDGRTINEGLKVVGRFQVKAPEGEDITESVPFYIDSLISKYPEALVKNEPFTEASGNVFKRYSDDGGNSYFLEFTSDGSDHELTVGDFAVPLPKFVPLKIEVAGWTPPKL
mgnify:FL=1